MLGIAYQCIYECDLVCIRCCFCVLYNKGQILIQVNKISILFCYFIYNKKTVLRPPCVMLLFSSACIVHLSHLL